MNPRIYFLLSLLLQEFPDIDLLHIEYTNEKDNVLLEGAKDSDSSWTWQEEIPLEGIYPLLPLLMNEDFEIVESSERLKIQNLNTKQTVKSFNTVLPLGVSILVYEGGEQKRHIFGEELSNIIRDTFCIAG